MRLISLERRSPLVLAAILFALLIVISGQVRDEKDRRVLKTVVQKVTNPFVHGAFGTFGWFSSVWESYMHLVGVSQENVRLKEELDILKLRQMLWAEERKRLKRMEELFNMPGMSSGKLIFGEIVFLNISKMDCTAVVNRGLKDGVKEGMNVATPQGLVGIVKEVDSSFSRIVLLIDTSSRIAVKIVGEGKDYNAILAGNGRGYYLDFIMSQEIVKIGDAVLTSGKDRMCIPGLPVGTVETVGEEYTGKARITISPSVNFKALDEVIILLSTYDPTGLKLPSFGGGEQ